MQFDFGVIDPATKSGSQLASDLNNQRNALNSFHLGAAEPVYKTSGMVWIDIAANPLWKLKMYDGSAWITLIDIDTVSDAASAYIGGLVATLGTAASLNTGTGPTQIPTNSLLGALAYLNTVGTSNIANGAITNALLAALSVSTGNLQNSAVTGQKVAAGTLDISKFAAQAANKIYTTNEAGVTILEDRLSGSGFILYKTAGTTAFTVPSGVTSLKVWVIGGGGGGNGVNLSSSSPSYGGSGGTSSFGSYVSAAGGASQGSGGAGIVGSGVDGFSWSGQGGDSSNNQTMMGGMPVFHGQLGGNAVSTFAPSINYRSNPGTWPGGGASGYTRNGYTSGQGAGAGGTALAYLTVLSGQVINATVGAGGSGGGGNYASGAAGAAGLVLVEW